MMTKIKRVIKFGWQSALRNKGLSLQVIFIMAVAVWVFTSLFVFRGFSNFLINSVEKRVDISVYFKQGVLEEDILAIKQELSTLTEQVETVDYISKEQAQEIFIEKHQNDPLYLNALDEVGSNPFLSSLDIKAKNPLFYGPISNFLSESPYNDSIERISYYQNKTIIEKLYDLTSNIKKAGIFLIIFLIILIFFITFNTIKLTIFALRDEIITMRLVGASNWFIRGPFIVQGIIYGLSSVFIIDILAALFFGFFSNGLSVWLFSFDFLDYFLNKFIILFVLQFVFAVLLGIASSFLAVRKYLKV